MSLQLLEELINDKLNTIVNDKLNTIINDKLNTIANNKLLNIIANDKVNDIDDMSDANSIVTSVTTSVASSVADSNEFPYYCHLPGNNEPTIEDIWKTLPPSLTLPTDKSKGTKSVDFDGSSLPLALGRKSRSDCGIPIRQFKLDYIVPNAHICIIGKRGSGKSWLCRNIMHHVDNKDQEPKIIIAPTDRMNPFYKNNFKKALIYYQYNDKILKALLGRQEKSVKYSKIIKRQTYNPGAFLIMDDCLASKGKWAKAEIMRELLMNSRHYKLAYILTMQFPLGISPELRTNFDYIFLFADDFVNNQKRIYEHYGGMFPSFSAFKQVFNELTKDYGCMVIVNRGKRETFNDKVFWFKAKN
uniref:Packaging ATPase n=1 Tax=Mimivirus LCMiAC02 TaxID=2506609 RepID=A0A4D5XEZ6_9VIRU|nr:MAG: packaging ATPase [Mimivirus LCMiAC02]